MQPYNNSAIKRNELSTTQRHGWIKNTYLLSGRSLSEKPKYRMTLITWNGKTEKKVNRSVDDICLNRFKKLGTFIFLRE